MKKITIEIPDKFDDALVITMIGCGLITNIKSYPVDLTDHDGDRLILSSNDHPKWVPIVNDEYPGYCDDGDEFYE